MTHLCAEGRRRPVLLEADEMLGVEGAGIKKSSVAVQQMLKKSSLDTLPDLFSTLVLLVEQLCSHSQVKENR